MRKLGFVGGSITAGNGWDLADPVDCANHWVTQVHNLPNFASHELVNRSIAGGSNEAIFANAIDLLTNCPNLDVLFCCWVSYPRYSFDVGFELYDTSDGISNVTTRNHCINTGVILSSYLNNIKYRFVALQHPHKDIVKIIKYHNIVNQLSKLTNVKIYHINDSCFWDNAYFTRLVGPNITPNNFTNYTKTEILNTINRDDQEIFALYKKMHDEYDEAGGINQHHWINLYNSFMSLQSDTNHDNEHPGKNSNSAYFNLVKKHLETH